MHDRFGALAEEVDAHCQVRKGAEAQMQYWLDIVKDAEIKTQVSNMVVQNLRSTAKTNPADMVHLMRTSLMQLPSANSPERTPTTNLRCRPFLSSHKDVENNGNSRIG